MHICQMGSASETWCNPPALPCLDSLILDPGIQDVITSLPEVLFLATVAASTSSLLIMNLGRSWLEDTLRQKSANASLFKLFEL